MIYGGQALSPSSPPRGDRCSPCSSSLPGGTGTFAAWWETSPWLPTDTSPAGEEGVSYVWDVDNVRFVSVTSDQELASPYDRSAAGLVWPADVLRDSEAERTSVVTHRLVSATAGCDRDTSASDLCQTLVAFEVVGLSSGHWHRYQPAQLGDGGATWETIIGTGGATPTRGPGCASALPHLSPPEA